MNGEQPRADLGRGLRFPIRINARGGFAMSDGQQKVSESIRIVLLTAVSERVMRSQFGSEVPNLLFEPLTPGTTSLLRDAIVNALSRWEPRIDVLEAAVDPDPDEPTRLVASLSYRIRENNSLLNQVFPFYIREGAEEY